MALHVFSFPFYRIWSFGPSETYTIFASKLCSRDRWLFHHMKGRWRLRWAFWRIAGSGQAVQCDAFHLLLARQRESPLRARRGRPYVDRLQYVWLLFIGGWKSRAVVWARVDMGFLACATRCGAANRQLGGVLPPSLCAWRRRDVPIVHENGVICAPSVRLVRASALG